MRDFALCLALAALLLPSTGASAEPARPSMMGGQRGPGKVGLDDGGALKSQGDKLAVALGTVSARLRQLEPSKGAWDTQCERAAERVQPASNDARTTRAGECVQQGRRLYQEGRAIEERCNRVLSAATSDVRTGSPAAQRRIMMVVDGCIRQMSVLQSKLGKHAALVDAVAAP